MCMHPVTNVQINRRVVIDQIFGTTRNIHISNLSGSKPFGKLTVAPVVLLTVLVHV